jgi:predicted peptidase
MNKPIFSFVVTCIFIFVHLSGTFAQQQIKKLQIVKQIEMNYLISIPANYDTEKDKLFPLMIFLHGAGERGNDINLVKKNGPPSFIDSKPDFPLILVSPQCPIGMFWSVDNLQALYTELIKTYRVDVNRVYLTGLSMGGFGTWAWASAYPKQFAAIAPICGGGEPLFADELIDLPIWAFHGDSDPIVPVKRTIEMVDAVNNKGGKALITIYKGVGHDSWTETYNNQELYDWFLDQSLLKKRVTD